jgi:hypothetical protein
MKTIFFLGVASFLAGPTWGGLLRGEQAPSGAADDGHGHTNRELADAKCCCDPVVIDFDTNARGEPVKPGTYVSDQWSSLGLHLSASPGSPRIFDTTNPGTEDAGDPDLGAPNNKCKGGGPGIGTGGAPGKVGQNCAPQGNALIIQEENNKPQIPDDNAKGGTITMDLSSFPRYVYEIGLLDIDEKARLNVRYPGTLYPRGYVQSKTIDVPNLGDNSFQIVKIDQINVEEMTLEMEGSGAITYIKFCPCRVVKVDFDFAPNGYERVEPGTYVSDEWSSLGLHLSASGGVDNKPRIFDTKNPGT